MANQFLLVLAAAAALQKPPTPPRPQHRKAVDDPALNSLNEPLTHSVLAHDDGAEHLGDVGGAHLDTDLSFSRNRESRSRPRSGSR